MYIMYTVGTKSGPGIKITLTFSAYQYALWKWFSFVDILQFYI